MNRKFLLSIVAIPGIMIIFSTCTKDIGRPAPAPVVVQVDSCKTDIKFAKQIQPILNTYCAINTGCHAQNNSWGNFTSHGGFMPKSSTAVTRIENLEMPPDYTSGPKTLTDCEISKLKAWVAAGSPNN